jgi:hypothetical protein
LKQYQLENPNVIELENNDKDSPLLSSLAINDKLIATLNIESTSDLNALFDDDDDNNDDFNNKNCNLKKNDNNNYSPIESSSISSSKMVALEKQPAPSNLLPNKPQSTAKFSNEKKEILPDHFTQCPSCKSTYTEKGNSRRIVDSCGHGVCFKCVVSEKSCFVCANQTKDLDSNNDCGEYESPQKCNNFGSNQKSLDQSPILLHKPQQSHTTNEDMKPLPIRKNIDLFAIPKPVSKISPQKKIIPDDVFVIDSIGTRPKSTKYYFKLIITYRLLNRS